MHQFNVLFRLDDVSAISNTQAELRIIDAFRARGFKLCVSLIPFVGDIDGSVQDGRSLLPLPLEKAAIIKECMADGTLEVSLHGYSHFSLSESALSEFAGMDYESQKQRVMAGKSFLEDLLKTHINIFVPPFNAYDTNTIKVLDHLEFRILSARIYGTALRSTRLLYIPATCDLLTLRKAIEAARVAQDRKPVIVAYFHHYDFKEVDPDRGTLAIDDLDGLLGWVAKQSDVTVTSMLKAAEECDLSIQRFIAMDKWRHLERFLPDRMKEKKPVLYYHEACALTSLRWKIFLLYFSLLLISGLSTFCLIAAISLFLPGILKIAVWGSAAAVSLTVLYIFRDFPLGRRGLASVTVVSGFLLGVLGHYFYSLQYS